MKERPILFSGPMVRAILDGRKTQTRRAVKHPYARDIDAFAPCEVPGEWRIGVMEAGVTADMGCMRCPFGEPGDRLWVRETWALAPGVHRGHDWRDALFAADGLTQVDRWRPSIHMPRWASRITLEVTGVRVERLQAITEEDARAEGAAHRISPGGDLAGAFDVCETPINYRVHFRDLWRDINGPDAWDANPWVWVVAFKRVTP
jgi:hypothetical protein